MTKIFFLRILILCGTISFAQDSIVWNSKKDKIKIPFELTNNLIIVDVIFNNISLKMIADTGADTSLLFSFPSEDSIAVQEKDRVMIKGVGSGEAVEAFLSSSNQLKINEYQDNNFEILIIPNQDINIINKLGIPINGILGFSFFKDFLVEINYENKKIILHKNKSNRVEKRFSKYKSSKIKLEKSKPYIDLLVGIEQSDFNLKLLFDTGLSDGLWLFENDKIICDRPFFNDFLGRGLSGDIKGKRSRVNKVVFSDIEINEALVSYPDSINFSQISIIEGRNGSLGGEIIKRFNWFLDYENETFYYQKNKLLESSFEYNMSGIEVQHSGLELIKKEYLNSKYINVDTETGYGVIKKSPSHFRFELKPVYEIYAVRENSPAFKVGLKVGDKIIKLNNKNANQLTLQSITELFQLQEGKRIKIRIERDGKLMDIEFNLEKIL